MVTGISKESVAKNGEVLELRCEVLADTKRYRKFKLPVELWEDEEPVVLFSGRHMYLLKGEENQGVKKVVVYW